MLESFLHKKNEIPVPDFSAYTRALKAGDRAGISAYFQSLIEEIGACSLVTREFCRAFPLRLSPG